MKYVENRASEKPFSDQQEWEDERMRTAMFKLVAVELGFPFLFRAPFLVVGN
jgi:hypothetical protein